MLNSHRYTKFNLNLGFFFKKHELNKKYMKSWSVRLFNGSNKSVKLSYQSMKKILRFGMDFLDLQEFCIDSIKNYTNSEWWFGIAKV